MSLNQVAKRIVNIRLTIEMHNLRGERFVMFTPYYAFVQYLIFNSGFLPVPF